MSDLVKRLRDMNGGWASDEALAAADRIEELEVKMAKAIEALTIYIYETTHLSFEEDDGSHWCKISKDCLTHARTTLAELTGGNDDW